MAPVSVPAETLKIAEDSYQRCQKAGDFLQAFYRRFLDCDEEIERKFDGTDFERQNKLLQHGIGLLFIYARRGNPAILERIAARHGPGDLNIAPRLYGCFVDTLVATVEEFDSQYRPEVGEAWRQALAPGVAFMISRRDEAARPPEQ